jgi:hypothetical protein
MNTIKITLVFLFLVAFGLNSTHAQEGHPLEGKWNLTIDQEGEKLPSWYRCHPERSRRTRYIDSDPQDKKIGL